ncbi:helix-turn-helix domain-containing protein [Chitinophaga horti]|uniref:Helix-turn-helix domain-containing protein n=1 Tax=Chitinophaga horti TaxID=2920382 RepID=A0ABY6IYD1_9BACT|nr:helix-turn-helix transcriptional regulator [Chitinophaga horti]UYQ92390.1 helix-turn-helix domain-containing protein [Chitinophaga horti]
MDLREIGDLVRKRRESFGLEREQLAEMGDVAGRTVYLLEVGQGNPSFHTLISVFDALGLEMIVRVKQSI